MNRILITLASIFIISTGLFSQSQNIQISLLTQDPGDEIYAFFGHTAIRIKDDSLNIDQVYNYGTFDFNTENFYLRFVKGDLKYCLSIDSYDFFVYMSEDTKRTIHEQVLNLTYEEKVNMLSALETCYNTDARYYTYDFFMNNCATKIRDIIQDATSNRIDFSTADMGGKTFRQLLTDFLKKNYWLEFSMNLAIGLAGDKEATPSDYMYLPVYIHEFLSATEYAETSTVLLDASPAPSTKFNFSYLIPWLVFLGALGLSLWSKSRKPILFTFSLIYGILGLFLLAVGIYSDHPALGQNLNVLWTMPALLVPFFRKKRFGEIYRMIYCSIIAIMLISWPIFPQELSPTFLPWMIIMIIMLALDMKIVQQKLFKRK